MAVKARLRCKRCRYERVCDRDLLNDLGKREGRYLAGPTALKKLAPRLKCSRCGKKGQVEFVGAIKARPHRDPDKPSSIKCVLCGRRTRDFRNDKCSVCAIQGEPGGNRGGGSCPRCGGMLETRDRRAGRTSYFIGCSNYPRCRYTVR